MIKSLKTRLIPTHIVPLAASPMGCNLLCGLRVNITIIGVSSTALKKYCRHRNIPTPPRGYWNMYFAGKLDECEKIKQKLLNHN